DRRFVACFGDDASLTVFDAERGKTLTRQSLPCVGGHRDEVTIDAKHGDVRFVCDDEKEKSWAVTVSFGAVQKIVSRALP
ncbi:MAG TPA: hypothetical protein VF407_23270, partial [Polyangiaceae bacterium]